MPLAWYTVVMVVIEGESVLKGGLEGSSTLYIIPAKEKLVIHLTKDVVSMIMAKYGAKTMVIMVEEDAEVQFAISIDN